MGVKKFLEKQDAGFISLHDLLVQMTNAGDGCTLQEAAIALSRLLWEAGQYESPSWLHKDPMRGITEANGSKPGMQLAYVAKNGRFEWEELSDDIPF